jgi:malonyl-CoA decarboxylase
VVELLRSELPHLRQFVTLSPIPGLTRWLTRVRAEAAPAAGLLEKAAAGGTFSEAETLALRRLAAHYLTEAKRADGMPLDPVARFHLGNGAQIYEVHAGADPSRRGVQQSLGTMVNYDYPLDAVEQNHENYAHRGTVAATRGVKALARAAEVAPAAPAGSRKKAAANDEPAE